MCTAEGILAVALASFFGLGSALYVRSVAYYDPAAGGGSMLDNAGDGLGEPLNVRFRAFLLPLSFAEKLTGHHLWP